MTSDEKYLFYMNVLQMIIFEVILPYYNSGIPNLFTMDQSYLWVNPGSEV